eukprot:scaffold5479_cov199-Amphora_coffeaeformis.AAC.83
MGVRGLRPRPLCGVRASIWAANHRSERFPLLLCIAIHDSATRIYCVLCPQKNGQSGVVRIVNEKKRS